MTKEERIEHAKALHKQGCNCCQAVLMAYADRLPIKGEDAMNVAAPFGRGLAGTREVCGLTGHTADTRALIERFREEEGDIVCGRLLAAGKKPCNTMIGDAAGLLAGVIDV